jgi:hypothetical protein
MDDTILVFAQCSIFTAKDCDVAKVNEMVEREARRIVRR